MDLNEVLVFIKVVQTGSFSQAAKQLMMPNSTVSSKDCFA
jgi:DNA-binding transcriptional LysR family regulator